MLTNTFPQDRQKTWWSKTRPPYFRIWLHAFACITGYFRIWLHVFACITGYFRIWLRVFACITVDFRIWLRVFVCITVYFRVWLHVFACITATERSSVSIPQAPTFQGDCNEPSVWSKQRHPALPLGLLMAVYLENQNKLLILLFAPRKKQN